MPEIRAHLENAANLVGSYIWKGFIPMDMYGNIDWFKIILAFVVSILIIIVMVITMWTSITSQVKNIEKCYMPSDDENVFVLVKNRYGEPMYKVSYDMKNRNSYVTCECAGGSNINNFTNIKVRDLKNLQDAYETKTCQCDKSFGIVDQLNEYYYGDQGIIRYMKTGDISAFNIAYKDQ